MYPTAIVRGKVVRFRLPTALARAQTRNAGKAMTEPEVIEFVEEKHREEPELERLIEAGLAGPFKTLTDGTWRRVRRYGQALPRARF